MTKQVFSVERPEDSLGFLLWQTTVTWQRLIKKALDLYDISHAQFVILAITLWFEGQGREVTQNLIIQQSKLDKMTVSKSLKILAAKNLVKRAEHKQDTRVKSVCLTAKGKDLATKLVPIIEKIDEKFFNSLNKTHRHRFLSYLALLSH